MAMKARTQTDRPTPTMNEKEVDTMMSLCLKAHDTVMRDHTRRYTVDVTRS